MFVRYIHTHLLLRCPRIHNPHNLHTVGHAGDALHRALQHARSGRYGASEADVVAHRKGGRIWVGNASGAKRSALVEPAPEPVSCF